MEMALQMVLVEELPMEFEGSLARNAFFPPFWR